MKLNNVNTSRHFEGKLSTQMSLDLENTSTIMNLLRNNIYTDPISSFVRELYSNAVDAHTKANIDLPIDINIEYLFGSNIFSIRDYGHSMDKDIIFNVYSKMGKSDKREDNNLQGGWGLGSKSALAYSDHFWIETYTVENNINIYRKWVQYIDESRVGSLTLLEENDSNIIEFLPGTKVSVPFNTKDLTHIFKSLSLYLTYTKSKFNFLNKTLEARLTLKTNTYNYFGKLWSLLLVDTNYWEAKHGCKHVVVIYDIPYKLDLELLKSSFSNITPEVLYYITTNCPYYIDNLKNTELFFTFIDVLCLYSFEINVPIGTLDISASRENLQYTKKTCLELYQYLYLFFIEFYKYLRIDLIHNPDFISATISYVNYPNILRTKFLSLLTWQPENLSFDKFYAIFIEKELPDTFKVYKLDKSWSKLKSKEIDVLNKIQTSTIYTGKNKYILCVQDSKYNNYKKYLKAYIQKNREQLSDTNFICVSSVDLDKVQPWILRTLDTVYLSNIIKEFNEDNPFVKKKPSNTNVFTILQLHKTKQRERARGLGAWCKEIKVLKAPLRTCYFLNEEELSQNLVPFLNLGITTRYPEVIQNFIERLNNYLIYKKISISNIYYIPTLTKNFTSSNWVNLLDVIKQDYLIHQSNLNLLGLNLFIYYYFQNHQEVFLLFNYKNLSEKNSLFGYLNNQYQGALKYLNNNKELESYALLINNDLQLMKKSLQQKGYNELFVDLKVPLKIQKECIYIYNECQDYLTKLPFLKYYRVKNYFQSEISIEEKDFLFYINLMEHKLNLHKMF